MDRQKEERERGVTISCTTKEFFTDKWHYTIIDAPGARGGLTGGCRRPVAAMYNLLLRPAAACAAGCAPPAFAAAQLPRRRA